MFKKNYHNNKQKSWYKPFLSDSQLSQNFAIRDAITKWEDKNGRKFRRALNDKEN